MHKTAAGLFLPGTPFRRHFEGSGKCFFFPFKGSKKAFVCPALLRSFRANEHMGFGRTSTWTLLVLPEASAAMQDFGGSCEQKSSEMSSPAANQRWSVRLQAAQQLRNLGK
jgi:hypothetical protein